MGDRQNGELRVVFDRRLKLEFSGSQGTTDAGLLAYRQLDEALELICEKKLLLGLGSVTIDKQAARRCRRARTIECKMGNPG